MIPKVQIIHPVVPKGFIPPVYGCLLGGAPIPPRNQPGCSTKAQPRCSYCSCILTTNRCESCGAPR